MPNKVKTIAFDYGNVLVIDSRANLEKKLGYARLSPAAKKKYDRIWILAGNGKYPNLKLMKDVGEIYDLKMTPAQVLNMFMHTPVIKPVWKLMLSLSKNYKIVVLTNNLKRGPETQAKNNRVSLRGIKIFNSAVIGVSKPDLRFYKKCLAQLKQKPDSIVFIDDRAENVKGARKAGINAIQFNGQKEKASRLAAGLKRFGVKVNM